MNKDVFTVTQAQKMDFLERLWAEYNSASRHMLPWRAEPYMSPYAILVSEFMLQQTQVQRVVPKFLAFMDAFPDLDSLRRAKQSDVISSWSGLGYYRRAKFLYAAAQSLPDGSKEVWSRGQLEACAGIGPNTAGAIRVYAYDTPELFIETNVRTVLLRHFFAESDSVSDKELQQILSQLLDYEHPRAFYWAIMDYGSALKRRGDRIARVSSHYKKQAPYEGSSRQLRASIIRQLADAKKPVSTRTVARRLNDKRAASIIDQLLKENMIEQSSGALRLKD